MTIENKIQALRDIAKILDDNRLFFDVNGINVTFTIEHTDTEMDKSVIYSTAEPVLDGDTFRDIANDLDQFYPPHLSKSETSNNSHCPEG